MSQTSEIAEARQPAAQSSGMVLAVALGLFVIGIAALPLLLVRVRASSLDLLAERFVVGELPDGLEVVESLQLPFGEQMLVLGDPQAAPERSPAAIAADVTESSPEEPKPAPAPRAKPSDKERRDFSWTSVEVGEPGAPPSEIVFVWYPRTSAERILRKQFSDLVFEDVDELEWEGGRIVIDSGQVPWSGYTTALVLERRFKRTGSKPTFHDTARCNLTVGGRCCVLYLRWPDGEAGSRAPIERLLDAIEPKS